MSSCCQTAEPVPESGNANSSEPLSGSRQWTLWFSFGLLVFLAGLTMTVTLAVNLDPPNGAARNLIHGFLALITAAALAGFGRPVFRRALRRSITLETLFLIGILGAFGASLYSTFTGTGHVYYEVVLVLLAIHRLGQLVSENQLARCRDLTRDIPGLRTRVRRQAGENWTETAIAKINIGDRVKTDSGEVIPIDGVIRSGRTYVEELAHTGEPFPVAKSAGGTVRAGTLALDGAIIIEATSTGTDREIDRLARELADSGKGRTEQLAQRLLDFFVPAVIVVATGALLYWGLGRGDWQAAIFNALAVALVACPCGLGLAIPLAARKERFRLSRLGLSLRDPDAVERFATVTTVIFDKTGTLTEPQITIGAFDTEPGAPKHLTAFLAAVQRCSTHPVARPFWNSGEAIRIGKPEITPLSGRGIEATFSHERTRHRLLIVNDAWVRENRPELETGCCCEDPAPRRLHIFLDGKKAATALLEETRRSSSETVLRELRNRDYQIGIVTGDTAIPAELHERLHFFETGSSIQRKAEIVRERRTAGERILFIGDGLNDAEAASNSHVSIALGSGSVVAGKVSAATLLHDDLSVIPEALDSTRRARHRLHRLLRFVLCYNAIGMTLAATGILHPVAAALLMLGSSATVLRWS